MISGLDKFNIFLRIEWFVHHFPYMFWHQLTLISDEDMLNTKGLVGLTEHEKVGWRWSKVENWDNKIYKRQTYPNLILLFNETCSFTSNFDFE